MNCKRSFKIFKQEEKGLKLQNNIIKIILLVVFENCFFLEKVLRLESLLSWIVGESKSIRQSSHEGCHGV